MILTILRILFLRLRNNPIELMLLFVMPVVFFSIFAAIFSNGIAIGADKKLRVGWIAGRQSTLAIELSEFLEANSNLECFWLPDQPSLVELSIGFDAATIDSATVDAVILVAQRSGRYDLIMKLPSEFPDLLSDQEQAAAVPVQLVTDGQNPMAVAVVTAAVKAFFAQKTAASVVQQLSKLSPASRTSSSGNQSGTTGPSIDEYVNVLGPDSMSLTVFEYSSLSQPSSSKFFSSDVPSRGSAKNPARSLRSDWNDLWLMSNADNVIVAEGALGLPEREHPLEESLGRRITDAGLGDEYRFLNPAKDLSRLVISGVQYRDLSNNPALQVKPQWDEFGLIGKAVNISSVAGVLDLPNELSVAQLNSGNWNAGHPEDSPPSTAVALMEDRVSISIENPQSSTQENPRIAMYAAGIVVLFVLFSATGNAAALLEEAESGTLDRIMIGKATLFHIVGGKWLGIFLVGFLQISVMFLWAELIFKIQLWKHLPGFLVMTGCTAAATSSFAMLMATLVKSRSQLNAASVVIILSMSAVGGSMIPRFVMSDRLKEIGQWTFNAWALDGYQKVFWYQMPISSLQTEVAVLLSSAVVFGLLALVFSSRWKYGW